MIGFICKNRNLRAVGYKQIGKMNIKSSYLNSKFPEDKLDCGNENFYIFVDGCILNKTELLSGYNADDFKTLILSF